MTVSGLGVGHFEDAGDAAHDRGAAAGFEVFLVLGAGLAQMHLAVDDAGQDVQARAVDRFRPPGAVEMADPGDAAAGDGDVAEAGAVVIDDGAALQDQIRPCDGMGFLDCACAAYVNVDGRRSNKDAQTVFSLPESCRTGRSCGSTGPDAEHFLHNLLTADIEGLAPGRRAYAALLTPQGKILFDFFVLQRRRRLSASTAPPRRSAELDQAAGLLQAAGQGRRSPRGRSGGRRFAGAARAGAGAMPIRASPHIGLADDCGAKAACRWRRL